MTFEVQMWRALGVYRVLALLYAVLLYTRAWDDYTHPLAGWAGIGLMTAWTLFTVPAYRRRQGRSWPVLAADLGLCAALIVGSRYVNDLDAVEAGAYTLPSIWVSGAVLAWSIRGGIAGGVAAAAVLGVANVIERAAVTTENVHNIVLLVLAGTVVGYAGGLGRAGERTLAEALRVEAATRERDRLARDIHDSVLQVLTLVQRRGGELGGEAAELGRLAGEQEVALRALVADGHQRVDGRSGDTDLRAPLRGLGSPQVTVSTPATPVLVPAAAAAELAAAVEAALDNVRVHVGPDAHAWVLIEEEPDEVVVTERDDGPGIPPGRLEVAAAEGRLGVCQSIRGRLRDLGGRAGVVSAPGQGTEVELRLPHGRTRSARRA